MRRLAHRSALLPLLTLVLLAGTAHGRPPPPDDYPPEPPRQPTVEWSTWVRVAYGAAPAPVEPRARVVSPAPTDDGARDHGWEAAAGADLTLPLGRGGKLRIGPWIEARTSSSVMVGGELLIAAAPAKLEMFWAEGEGVLVLRAGGNRELETASVAYGYRAPWDLLRSRPGRSSYRIGVRMVATATRSQDDPGLWSATLGVETEPVGALRYLLGIRSWY